MIEPTFCFDEFLHGLCAEAQNQLVKALRKVFIIQGFLHFVGGCECLEGLRSWSCRHHSHRLIDCRILIAAILVEIKWLRRTSRLQRLIIRLILFILRDIFEHRISI